MSAATDRYVDEILDDIGADRHTVNAGALVARHAARLDELGPVRVVALDPCPRCAGNVIASTDVARCTRCDYTVAGGHPMTPLEALAWVGVAFAVALAIVIIWVIVVAAKLAARVDRASRPGYLLDAKRPPE